MDFNRGKSRIMDALLEHKGVQHLVDEGSDALGNPVFVCDLAAQVLAMSHSSGIHRGFWDSFLPGGELIPQVSVEVGKAGIYEKIFSSNQPVLGEFDFYSGRIFGARLRSRDGDIGIVTLLEDSPMGDRDLELLMVLAEAIVLELSWNDRASLPESSLSRLANAVIDGAVDTEELSQRLASTGVQTPPDYRVVVAGLEAGHAGVLLSISRDRLEKMLPTSPCFNRHGRIVMLLDVSRGQDVPVDKLRACFSELPIRVGVGGHAAGFGELARSYEQARAAMRFSRAAGLPGALADYDDWRIHDFLVQAGAKLDLRQFVDPVEREMRVHDRIEGTQLLETLEAYLRCANNAQAAARLLGIHKNTMYGRLERIQNRFDVNLESGEACFSLWLSLRIERVLEDV